MFCPKCKTSNEANTTVCSSCGDLLPRLPGNFQSAQESAEAAGKVAEYYKAILGPENQEYYLDVFTRFDRDETVSPTWHWPAFLANFFWLLYRKMWPAALIYLLAPLLLMGLLGGLGALIGNTFLVSLGYVLCALGMVFLLPVFANALYYQHCKKQIVAVSAASADMQQQLGELAAKGGTSNVAFMGVVALVSVAVLGIVAVLAKDYSVKAHTAQAYALGKSAAGKVSDFYLSHQAIPTSLSEAGFGEPTPSYVRDIGMSPRNGAVTVTMEGSAIGGKSFTLEPSLDEGGQLQWSCMSEQIQDKYLPQQCRHQN